MDSRIQLLLEDEFLDRVITPIERYMTEKMTEEKITIAKTNTYPIIKKQLMSSAQKTIWKEKM